MGLSEQCCGMLLSSIGLKDRATQHVARLRRQISAAGASKLVTACSGCHGYLKHRLPGVEVVASTTPVPIGLKLSSAGRCGICSRATLLLK